MLFQRVSSTTPEQMYSPVFNAQGTTLTTGYAVCYDFLATTSLGNAVSKPRVSTYTAFAGIVAGAAIGETDIANNAVGLVQVYGYCPSTYANLGAASVSAAGLGLGLGTSFDMISVGGWPKDGCGPINSAIPIVAVMENDVSGNQMYVKSFIRAL